jgi:hypothetical protein
MNPLPFHGSDDDTRRTRWLRRLVHESIRVFKKRSTYFATYHERAKLASMVGTWADMDESGVAIVMQGPLWRHDSFTIETLKLYRNLYPRCQLIVSTWNDTPKEDLVALRAQDVELVLLEKPTDPGQSNVNMQIVSTSQGIAKAKSLGAQWVLKTRTDQRTYNPNLLSFLIGTARTFPVIKSSPQRHRIIGIGQGSLKYVPYHVTDQTLFGHVDDMVQYWSTPLRPSSSYDAGDRSLSDLWPSLSIRELLNGISAEPYITSEYLKRLGRELDWTIEDSWNAYRDHFCFVDYAATDFYWVKGQDYTLTEYMYRYDTISNRKEMNFSEWMLMYSGQLPTELGRDYEQSLEDCFNVAVRRPLAPP